MKSSNWPMWLCRELLASEKSGSFTNMEGRIQSFSPVVPPPGEAKPDWEILDLLATRLGAPERYGTVEKIRKEIRRSGSALCPNEWFRDRAG